MGEYGNGRKKYLMEDPPALASPRFNRRTWGLKGGWGPGSRLPASSQRGAAAISDENNLFANEGTFM